MAFRAFGKKAQYFTIILLILVTFLTLVAYMVLARDLSSSLVQFYVFGHEMVQWQKNLTAICLVLVVSPALFFRNMNALKFTSILSSASVFVLALTITIRAVGFMKSGAFDASKIVWVTNSTSD